MAGEEQGRSDRLGWILGNQGPRALPGCPMVVLRSRGEADRSSASAVGANRDRANWHAPAQIGAAGIASNCQEASRGCSTVLAITWQEVRNRTVNRGNGCCLTVRRLTKIRRPPAGRPALEGGLVAGGFQGWLHWVTGQNYFCCFLTLFAPSASCFRTWGQSLKCASMSAGQTRKLVLRLQRNVPRVHLGSTPGSRESARPTQPWQLLRLPRRLRLGEAAERSPSAAPPGTVVKLRELPRPSLRPPAVAVNSPGRSCTPRPPLPEMAAPSGEHRSSTRRLPSLSHLHLPPLHHHWALSLLAARPAATLRPTCPVGCQQAMLQEAVISTARRTPFDVPGLISCPAYHAHAPRERRRHWMGLEDLISPVLKAERPRVARRR
ncbi:hypothetical protein BU16DRAFT_535931 [Lophium mytilinum]|uniref:Uncharacterized protein n=1 Tax=Lophium mytilinum TaxID=390894 RepID=A0A6A6R4B6_9PEZI|nr:hypothetical protein BU16DRAFT_535931 [Lophium mytilinum]